VVCCDVHWISDW